MGYYNKVPETGWLISGNLFLKCWRLKVQDQGAGMVRQGPFLGFRLLVISTYAERVRDLSGESLIRAIIPGL